MWWKRMNSVPIGWTMISLPVAGAGVCAKGRHGRLGHRRIQAKQRIVETRVGRASVGRGGLASGTHNARRRGYVRFQTRDARRVTAAQCARRLRERYRCRIESNS